MHKYSGLLISLWISGMAIKLRVYVLEREDCEVFKKRFLQPF